MNLQTQIFLTFFKHGWLAIGSDYTVLPAVEAAVAKNGWLTEAEMADCVATAQALPGLFSLNLAACIGRRVGGLGGSIAAVGGSTLPAFVSLLVIATFFMDIREYPGVERFLRGVRPGIVALLALAAWRIGRKAGINMSNLWLPIITLVAVTIVGLSPTAIVVAAAFAGYLYARFIRSDEASK